jgi:MinD-like ATPase involved in chromosome partitioning or flagellar assembly
VQYTSVNAAVSSDLSVIVSTLDSLDLSGTTNLLLELYDAFEKKTAIVLNKVFPEKQPTSKETLNQISANLRSPIIGTIPCYCRVLQADRSTIMAFEDPQHPFIKNLEDVVENLVKTI